MRLKLFTINSFSLTFGIALLVAALCLFEVPVLELIELKTYDLRFQSREVMPSGTTVVLALIDEKSLDTEGRWPWPRSKIARVVDHLSRDGARVIGFDIGFLEPDENSQLGFIRELGRLIAQIRAPRRQARRIDPALRGAGRPGFCAGSGHTAVVGRCGPRLFFPHERGRPRLPGRTGGNRTTPRADQACAIR